MEVWHTGILEKNGVTYYLTPKMVKNVSLVEVDGVAYQIVENGVATSVNRWILSKRHLKSFVLCVKWEKLGEWAG